MGAFLYKAVDGKGRRNSGVVEAASASAARRLLRERALLPVSVQPTQAGRGRAKAAGPRIGLKPLVLVTRQLATLIGSGVRIEDALKTVADQKPPPRVATLLFNLRAAVLDGRSLADALDDEPRTFDHFYRASVRAGESSGRLGEVMDHLADHVEKRAKNRQTVQLALLYPALLSLVSVAVIVALLVFVVPDIVRVFATRGADLPLLTRLLIGLSDGMVTYGPAVLGAAALLGLGAVLALRAPARRAAWHRTLSRAPVFGGFVRRMNAAQYASTLATLVVSRVPLSEALSAAADTVPNLFLRARAQAVAVRVREGQALSRAMQEAGIFPPLLVALVASGEASGKLGDTLTRAADQQTSSLEATVATVVGLVEPGVLLVMGGIVMLLVLSILLPIMGLNELAI